MNTNSFHTTVALRATPQQVFNAIADPRAWWSNDIEGTTDQLNGIFIYRDKYLTAKMKLTQVSLQKVVWEVLESDNEFFKHKTEWDGTQIVFEITGMDHETKLDFTHVGLTPSFECFTVCSNSWDYFIRTSLKDLVLTGKGKEISKSEKSYSTSFVVGQSPEVVFNAIIHVRKWWSENIEGSTDQANAEFNYHYLDVHNATFKILELSPQRIVWFVKDNYFNFTEDKSEWKGTKIIFDISTEGKKTKIVFTHHGLVPAYECYQVCHDAWTHYILDSLKNLIETGKGSPTPKEADNAATTQSTGTEDASAVETKKSICHRLLIEAPVEKVYKALTTQEGLAGWWTPDTIAKPELGSIARFGFGPDYFKEMKITELKPYSRVQWLCLKAAEEWISTTLSFELEPHRKGAVLFFRHEGWKSYSNEFASCSYDWALFFRSLKFFCETGKGFPYPEFNV